MNKFRLTGLALMVLLATAVLFTACPNNAGGKTPAEYTVKFNVDGGNGTLTAAVDGKAITAGAKVQTGKTVKFTAAPTDASTHDVDYWTVSGGSFATAPGSGTTAEVKVGTKDLTVKVKFKPKGTPSSQFIVNFAVDGGNGTLKAEVDGTEIAAGAKVQVGKTVKFTAKPDGGYKVDTWNVTGGTVTSGGESGGTAAEVEVGTEDLTVKVTFKPEGTTPPAPAYVQVPYDTLEDYLQNTASSEEINYIEVTGLQAAHLKGAGTVASPLGEKLKAAPDKQVALKLPETVAALTDMSFCFLGCENLVSVDAIPETVTTMLGCFLGCTNLETAPVIPAGVTAMKYCFSGCTKLTGVTLTCDYNPGSGGTQPFENAFADCTALTEGSIKVPQTQLSAYKAAAEVMGTEADKFAAGGTSPSGFTVNFSVDGTGGTLKAEVDGAEISSGTKVQEGKTVIFTAKPDPGYMVEQWTNGGALIAGAGTGTAYSYSVTAEADIKVKFQIPPELAVDQAARTVDVGDNITYKLVTAGSGDYTVTAEDGTKIQITFNASSGNVTVKGLAAGVSRIKVKDNISTQEKYSGAITVEEAVTPPPPPGIPDYFEEGGVYYEVNDKENRYVWVTSFKPDGGHHKYSGVLTIPATVTHESVEYTVTSYGWMLDSDVTAINVTGVSAYLSSQDGILFNADKTVLIQYPYSKTGNEYTVPASVKGVGFGALGNKYWTKLIVSEGVTSASDNNFTGDNLAEIHLPVSLTKIQSGSLWGVFKKIKIPGAMEFLQFEVLMDCKQLEEVDLPAELKTIYPGALSNCDNLNKVICRAVTPPEFYTGSPQAFDGSPIGSATLYVPAGSVDAYKAAPVWKKFGTIKAIEP